ncbi:non-homologous end joining protein Ku [Capillimicrobium parvum]|uniref:Non-homologous end joining protein Ku n=1 Tax=Capillimicrobium parvum TaxID=2884022 RepID=A0A9E6Y187_9ACTN|nr:Ku protein [Capillimicrobium parvum]UGS38342.1 Non-homologous end joining protein Ku [Capillimicrobium parvum]
MAPRSLWTGAVSFGLVNVPVALRSATRDLAPHFNLVDEKTRTRIEIRRVCSKEDKPVDWDEVAHGHEVDGECVMVTDDELSALEPRRTRTIDIEAFVDVAEIDPALYDSTYFVVPVGGEGAARAYRLLAEVMDQAGEAALGRFVLRTREYLAAMRVRDGVITLSTLLFADELRPASALGDARPRRSRPAKKKIDQAVKLIEALGSDFDPTAYEDRHRKQVEQLVKAKRKGQEIETPDEPETPAVASDLMKALEESIAAVRG